MTENRYEKQLRIVRKYYPVRTTAVYFTLLAGYSVFYSLELSVPYFLWIGAWLIIWPHIAYLRCKNSVTPLNTERDNMIIESFMAGLWMPLIGFNFIVCIALSLAVWTNNIVLRGMKFFAFGLVIQCLAGMIGIYLFGFLWQPHSSMLVMFATTPLLVVYPLLLAHSNHNFSQKWYVQKRLLSHLSQHDALTTLFNRGHWEELLIKEFTRFNSTKTLSSLLFVDVDHFKTINDTHGHVIGDKVLREIGLLIIKNVRGLDDLAGCVAGRYGGEEFGIILPGVGRDVAWKIGERLREAIQNADILCDDKIIKITVSIGISECSETIADYSQWLALADKALYEAKSSGRNKTVVGEI